VSLVERACMVVPDVGVRARVPKDAWVEAVVRVQDAVALHGVGEAGVAALCEAVEALGDVLEQPMPRREDDEDELEDVA